MKDLHPKDANILWRINTDIIGFSQIYSFHDSLTDLHSGSAVMGIYNPSRCEDYHVEEDQNSMDVGRERE